jgi:hypothetical protein
MLISCKRPVITCGPLSPLGGPDVSGAPAAPAFVGCISGLGGTWAPRVGHGNASTATR